jgi:phosphoglycerol transferase MdoB-like AlkP superfamily enzyme
MKKIKINSEKIKNTKSIALLQRNPIILYGFIAIVLTFVIESFSKRVLWGGFITLFENPIMFIYNTLIVMLFLSLASFFKKRNFVIILITVIWLGLGVGNFILLSFRTTPLTGNDIEILRSVIGIIDIYLSPVDMVIIGILLIFAFFLIIMAFIKSPKVKPVFKSALFTFCCTLILLLGTSKLAHASGALKSDFGNLAEAYQSYGFSYCFSTSIIDRGIEKPKEYSREAIDEALDTVVDQDVATPVFNDHNEDRKPVKPPVKEVENIDGNLFPNSDIEHPNVIVIQLESFFDVNYMAEARFSEDPIPNFTTLKENFSSGFLRVPSIGAGTANTEFEVLSGMNLNYFGAGEYPYKTVLKETAIESTAYNLKENGYKTHAIHNNTGTFYSRHLVYPHLGFDSFSSIEYMQDLEYNPLGWAKDFVLEPEIIKALEISQAQDFVFAVSVQPHGKYPDDIIDDHQFIDMEVDLSEEDIIGYEYFINQLREVDEFIGNLVEYFENYHEPTLIVFYGDHLPSLDIQNENLENSDIFQTEYVLWSNFELEKVNRDLEAYQLSAYILERLGFDNGILTKYHQNNIQEVNYEENLHLLQYDMLYGDLNVYNGLSPYEPTSMTMGSGIIKIVDVIEKGDVYLIKGENFSSWSQIYVGDDAIETFYIDSETLFVDKNILDIYTNFHIAQVTDKNKILSISLGWQKEQ